MCVQGEPEFERLKRELEEVKNAPRGLEGTFRTAAEMERHRAQVCCTQEVMKRKHSRPTCRPPIDYSCSTTDRL